MGTSITDALPNAATLATIAKTQHGAPPGNPYHPLRRKQPEDPPHAVAELPRAAIVRRHNPHKRTPRQAAQIPRAGGLPIATAPPELCPMTPASGSEDG
jgi:hypothetical protein